MHTPNNGNTRAMRDALDTRSMVKFSQASEHKPVNPLSTCLLTKSFRAGLVYLRFHIRALTNYILFNVDGTRYL